MPGPASIAAVAIASLGGEGFGVSNAENSPAADGAALTMLAVIFLVIGGVVAFGWAMARRSRRPDETLRFLEGLSSTPPPKPAPTHRDAPSDSPPSWERPPDWWKQK